MVKKILLISAALVLTGYLAFAIVFINPKANTDNVCKTLKIEVVQTDEAAYLDEKQIEALLNRSGQNPIGKNLSEIRMESLEKAVKENKLIKQVESYKTIDGNVHIKVYPRTPALRIFSETGSYYVDSEGEIMPIPSNFSAYVPVATGKISEEYAKKQLSPFALFLKKNKYWNEQIEQIHVAPNLDIELTPRKGDHSIILGKIENYPENLDKLELFYDKGLDKVGWNRYSVINLKYKNQVVCTKRD
ncbi:cell division protein FtsQ [Bacteroidia bacterium]|nr:cell division protein FtsQ [Bacteroidia bacterium]